MAKTPLLVPAGTVLDIRRRCLGMGLPDPGSICIVQALAFWDEVSPGHGLDITQTLEAFYAYGTRLPLTDPQPVLETISSGTLDWLGVRHSVAVGHLTDARRTIGMELGEVQGLPLDVQLGRRAQEELNATIGTWLTMRLPELVWDTLEHRLVVGVERHFSDDERSAAYELVHRALSATLTCAVSALIAGTELAYRPLLDLWLAGNWPVGCTADGALVVFTRPAQVVAPVGADSPGSGLG
ncbi:MAG: hypothetical protein IT198_16905 [Acidimicrobiia bacterium]|nr:hypothetical protein [Acidimicrobiia bacterium]